VEDRFIPPRIQVLVGQNEQVQELVVGLVSQALQMEQNLLRVLEECLQDTFIQAQIQVQLGQNEIMEIDSVVLLKIGDQSHPLQMEQNLLQGRMEDTFIPAQIQVQLGQNKQIQDLVVGLQSHRHQMEQIFLR
jgi:hypothetical protein